MRVGDNDERSRRGVLTPVTPEPGDDPWSRIGTGLRAMLGDALVEALPNDMLWALKRLGRAEAERKERAAEGPSHGHASRQPIEQEPEQAAGHRGTTRLDQPSRGEDR